MKGSMNKPRILPSFLKGLKLQECIVNNPSGMRLVDLSREMGMPPSNITLYLNTMIHAGIVSRDPLSKRFFISPRGIELFHDAGESLHHKLIPCAEEPMRYLHERFNENVLLAVQKRTTFEYIKYINTSHIMRIGIEPGPEYAMHVTAAGRAILAFLPQKAIDKYMSTVSFVQFTDKTVKDKAALQQVLAKTREQGYAFNSGEVEEGVMAVAAPIVINKRLVASLVVQFLTIRHSQKEAEDASKVVVQQARKIEGALRKMM